MAYTILTANLRHIFDPAEPALHRRAVITAEFATPYLQTQSLRARNGLTYQGFYLSLVEGTAFVINRLLRCFA
mgnify:CR=1 FL=1